MVCLFPSLRTLALVALGWLAGLLALAAPVQAHPHIWIDTRAEVVFDDAGRVAEIRHTWTFDEAFSAWTIQGLDTNGDGQVSSAEMQELAEENMVGLAEYDFYTFAGEGDTDLVFQAGPNPSMVYENGQTTLRFSVLPAAPYAIRDRLEIEVSDPEYYAALSFPAEDATTLVNAPEGCAVISSPPKELDEVTAQRLWEIGPDTYALPPDLKAALVDVSNVAVVTCLGGSATAFVPEPAPTAVEAIEQVIKPNAPVFAAPPPELTLTPDPKTGFLGWVYAQQKAFYGLLTNSLSVLKNDTTAFWVLGSLSFLYGVFHAAGPGHGKMVISSYVLASESQLRQGIVLSFLAAQMQSLVAIAIIMVAAVVLNMTSIAMSGVTAWIETGSYALVVMLGLYLVARKLFGLGHAHTHDHAHHHDHAHDHDAACACEHVVTPKQAKGSWREALGVVTAVGLRPCSGALVVLVFALSQGLLGAGILAVLLMGLGTGLTVSVLASLAVGAKSVALRIGERTSSGLASTLVWWLELLGALAVLAFGVVLLLASLQ